MWDAQERGDLGLEAPDVRQRSALLDRGEPVARVELLVRGQDQLAAGRPHQRLHHRVDIALPKGHPHPGWKQIRVIDTLRDRRRERLLQSFVARAVLPHLREQHQHLDR